MLHKISNLIILAVVALASCKKEPLPKPLPQPEPMVEMIYTSLNDESIYYQQGGLALDVNNDAKADLFFDVQLIGDHINKVDKRQFIILTSIYTSLPVNINEQVAPLNANDMIPLGNFNGNNWYNASEIILMERNEFANGSIIWRGNWIDRGKKYMPFQIVKNNERYNGWIELTADKTGERLVLHRMAISKESEKDVKAGK